MKIIRLVTGTDDAGKAVVASHGPAPRAHDFVHTPGFGLAMLWATQPNPRLPVPGDDPTGAAASFVPGPGGTCFAMLRIAPDKVMQSPDFDVAAAVEEQVRLTPGIADRMEHADPGMHRTDTIDYGIVLEGEVELELDDSRVETLRRHDVFVQNGTRHRWSNKGDVPALLAVVLIGAERRG